MEAIPNSSMPFVAGKMKQRNFRRAIQTTILCLSLVYVSFLVVWTASSPSKGSSSGTNRNDTPIDPSDSYNERTLYRPHKYLHRQLKNDVSNEIAIKLITNQLNSRVEASTNSASLITSPVDLKSGSTIKSDLSLDDIFLSIKTTRIFHQSRLEVILNTWFRLAKNQVCASSCASYITYNR